MVYIKSSSACEYFDYDNDKEKGSEKLDYIYANGKIWSEVVTSESTKNTYYHHTDHLGTTVCITDSTGKLLDENTNLYYFNARWYDSDIGRFISEDPARYGANWYGYAGQNPMVYVDPTGLAPYINGIYDGDYNPDYNPGVPVEGPKTNPNGMPPNQTPNITEPTGMPNEVIPTQQDNSIWIYDSSDKFQDFPSFNYNEYLRQQFYAELYAIDASVRDLLGKIGNSIVNIFTGKASYNVYANASINILNINCSIFDLKIGSKGQDLSFSLDQKAADQFLETFEKLIDAPITLTTSKLKVNIGDTSFTLQNDKTNLKVNVNFGKNKTIDLGALGEGSANICAGINITTNMNNGPFGTMVNGKNPIIENDKSAYKFLKSSDRIFELIEFN